MSSMALIGGPMTLEGGRPRRNHTKIHRRKHGKSAARKSHKKHSRRRHRGGGHYTLESSPYPYITAGGKRKHKKSHRRKRGKSAARKSHKKRHTHRRRRHRGGAGIMSVINKAVVPFSLYKLQKRMQDMTRKARKHLYKSKR